MDDEEDKPLIKDENHASINDDAYTDIANHNTPSINGNYVPITPGVDHSLPGIKDDFQVGLERARSRYVTVEVPIILCCLSLSILSTVRPEYLRERIATDIYHVNTSALNNNSAGSCGANSSKVEDDIQATTSTWLLYLGAINSIPGLFMAIVLGSISDRLGRKPALCLCLTGYTLDVACNIIVTYFKLPIMAFIPGDLIAGLCGGLALLLSTGASYVSDVSSAKMRTIRIVIVETSLFLGFGIGQVALGFALQDSTDHTLEKYVLPLWIALGCALASLVYVLLPWFMIETVNRKQAERNTSQISKVFKGIYHLIKENTNKRRMKVLGYAGVMMFGVFVIQSSSQVFVVYSMGEPFCLGPLDVSFVSVTSVVSGALGLMIGGAVLPRFIADNWIIQLSLFNSMLTCIITGLATTKVVLYISSGLSLLKTLSFPVIRSQLSKVSAEHERGLMLAFIGCMDGLAAFLSPLISNSIYAKTLYFYPPFIFFFLGGLQIFPVLITGFLQYQQRTIHVRLVNGNTVN